ncbi:unnamed protein product, partial [Protopolystoma xenopodis]
MTLDDLIYVISLLISLLCGPLICYARGNSKKPVSFLFVGISLFTLSLRSLDSLYFSEYLKKGKLIFFIGFRFIHIASFIWCFGYLGYFRTSYLFGHEIPTPHTNALQLLLTLRLIGLGFELHDSWLILSKLEKMDRKCAEWPELKLREKFCCISLNVFDIFCYSYCYIGLFTDMCEWPLGAQEPSNAPLQSRLQEASLFGIYVRTDEFFLQPFFYRFFYMFIMFVIFRARIYSAWKMSEAVCISARLGIYPSVSQPRSGAGPTRLDELE